MKGVFQYSHCLPFTFHIFVINSYSHIIPTGYRCSLLFSILVK